MKYEINKVTETTDIIVVIDWSKKDVEFLSRGEYEESKKEIDERMYKNEVEVLDVKGTVNDCCLEELQGVTDNDWND